MNAIVKQFLVASFFLLVVSSAVSESPNAWIDPAQHHPIITGDEPLPSWSSLPNNEEFPPPPAVDTIGNVYRAGQTWYDLQYIGSGGRMIQYDSVAQCTHVAWTCGYDSGASTIQVKYSCFDASTQQWMMWLLGQRVTPQTVTRSAFTSLGLFSMIPFPALHESNPRATVPTGNVYHDIEPAVGCFISDSPLPLLSENGSTIQTNWPKIAIGRNGAVHLVTTEGGATSIAGMQQWYHRGMYDPLNATITWGQPQLLPGRTMNVAGEVAASRISNRAAVAWMRPVDMDRNPPPAEFSPYNNNVVCAISQNGLTWNFNNYQYISHWRLPNPALYPDTLAACRDTFRAYNDISLLFDNSDVLHAVFTTNLYYTLPEPRIYTYGHIWHWRSDEPNTLCLVAEGGNRNVTLHGNPSAWNRTVQNGSLSIGQNGNLYCTFTACYDPRDTANTLNDISHQGRPNYDIYVSVSTDGGHRWSTATNITETHTPNAVAGQCRSECFPSSYQKADTYLHVSYLTDFDAGSAVLNEGSWTNNDFNYHRVPVASIPTTPLLPERNINFTAPTPFLRLTQPNGGDQFYIG
ncbi:MAG: hypothetical protein OEM52_12810, partial [bacterium]|nr:hypothetical protein [bacterium]